MGRIISGTLGSLRLASPAKASRPTTDRVRESLFGLLEARGYLADAKVLDLFAGTGALGLEAVSRGAQAATLVERDRQAIQVIRQNVAVAHKALMADNVQAELAILEGSVRTKLQQLKQQGQQFDLIFADPPYDFSTQQIEIELEGLAALLATDGLLILERDKSGFAGHLPQLELEWEKSYGDTRVLAFGYSPRSSGPV